MLPPNTRYRPSIPPAVPAQTSEHSSESLVQVFTHPPGKVYLLHGDRAVFTLSLTMASAALTQGTSVAVVDGGNCFDVHMIARFARERRLDPSLLLNRIFISRGFTCYQMEQAITRRLPSFLRSKGSTTAMIFNPLETLYDEQAPLREVQHILVRVLNALEEMKSHGISLLLACLDRNVRPDERNHLFTTLAAGMDRIYQLTLDDHQHYLLHPEHHLRHPLIMPASTQRHTATKGANRHGTHRTDIYQYHRK